MPFLEGTRSKGATSCGTMRMSVKSVSLFSAIKSLFQSRKKKNERRVFSHLSAANEPAKSATSATQGQGERKDRVYAGKKKKIPVNKSESESESDIGF